MPTSANVWIGIASVLASALLVPLVALITVRRSKSGQVSTSEAKDLWEESRAIRLELRAEIEKQAAALKAERLHNEETQARLLQLQEDQEVSRVEQRHSRDEIAQNRVALSSAQSYIAVLTQTLRAHGIEVPDPLYLIREPGILPAGVLASGG